MPNAASRKTPTPSSPASDPNPANGLLFVVAMALCLTGLAASTALVLKHFGAVSLPGCGTGGGCDAASASIWGSIYGVPVSIIGTAHFLAMLTIVVLNKGRVSNIVVWGMRLAAAVSLIYVGIALGANLICSYCIAIHIANVLLALTLARAGSGTNYDWKRQVAIGAVAATAAYGFLLPLNYRAQVTAQRRAEAQLAESTAQITAQAAQKPTPAAPQDSKTTPQAPQATPNKDAATPAKAGDTPDAAAPEAVKVRPLDGRYRFGPAVASVRIVMFTDYQCPDCYKIEQELKALMQSTPGLSVGIRYFPLSNKCNPAMGSNDLHPNACWAARAAETAGMLKGADGFWQMHHWLFDRKGGFTDAELVKGLTELGYDPVGFQKIMMSEETKKRVSEDVAFGQSLGIYFTPMIFINGVELRGWNAPNALTRAVTAAVAANPPAVAVGQDLPPDARSKYFEDWRAQPKVNLPPAVSRHSLGPADAKVHAVLVGDYSEKNTGDADGILRLFTSGPKPNIRYSFVQYPAHSDCNPTTQVKLNATACLAAKAAEAADVIGGPDAFWAVHNHLMSNQAKLDMDTVREAAAAAGLNADDLTEAMQQPFVTEAIATDARLAMSLGIKSLPMIFINGKFVPRWKLNNENLLGAMIFEADGSVPGAAEPEGK